MSEPELDLRVTGPVGTVVQVGRLVLEPAPAPPVEADTPAGREDELTAVLQAVAAGRPGVVLAGEPGLGTTALALAAAARLSARYGGGVRFVPLAGPDPGPALRELLRDLGVSAGDIPASTPRRAALLRAVLAAAPTLLVLDGARSAAQVRALLPGSGSAALVTAANPLDELRLDGLAVVPVAALGPHAASGVLPPPGSHHCGPASGPPPLLCPAGPGEPCEAAPEPSVARSAEPSSSGAEPPAPPAAGVPPTVTPGTLLAACQGSPLAARLLAGAGPAAALREFRRVQPAPHDAASAARAAARIALAALSAAEREVLEAALATGLSLVDPARCGALLGDGVPVGALLRALLRKGLLSPRPGPGDGPWCAIPTAVVEALPTEADPGDVRGARADRDIDPGADAGVGPELDPGAAPGAARPGGGACPAAAPPVDPRACLPRSDHPAGHADPVAAADVLVRLATGRAVRADGTAALAAASAALDLADRTGDPLLLGRAAHRLAAVLAEDPDPDGTGANATEPGATGSSEAGPGGAPPREAGPGGDGTGRAVREARIALDLAVELLASRDDAAHAHALTDRAHLARRRGRPAAALADLHAALALYRTLGLPAEVAAAWQEVAAVERAAGKPCRAVAAHRSALAALAEAGDRYAVAWSRLDTGLVQVGELPGAPAADLLAARVADGPAARSAQELQSLHPAAPDWALVAALTAGTTAE
ncbi:hypothetical protein ACL02T_06640 [Pseudonocardia sp. RS010]|uniref:hypothetical protein n=1 Tax=Pseudonocardia sp. RS010 TaxID=3385979 RepID=UPI0039A34AA5